MSERRASYMGRITIEKSVTCGRCERYNGGIKGATEIARNGWVKRDLKEGWLCPDCALESQAAVSSLFRDGVETKGEGT